MSHDRIPLRDVPLRLTDPAATQSERDTGTEQDETLLPASTGDPDPRAETDGAAQ